MMICVFSSFIQVIVGHPVLNAARQAFRRVYVVQADLLSVINIERIRVACETAFCDNVKQQDQYAALN